RCRAARDWPLWTAGSPPACELRSPRLSLRDGLLDQLGLLDRHLRRRRRALLERPRGGETADRGEQEERAGDDQISDPRIRAQQVGQRERDEVQEVDEPGEDEHAGRGADRGTLRERLELLRELGLRELDLLVDEQRRLLGDLLDRLAE